MAGRITRITRIGFEIRVEVSTDDQVVTVTLHPQRVPALGAEVGSTVQVRIAPYVPTPRYATAPAPRVDQGLTPVSSL